MKLEMRNVNEEVHIEGSESEKAETVATHVNLAERDGGSQVHVARNSRRWTVAVLPSVTAVNGRLQIMSPVTARDGRLEVMSPVTDGDGQKLTSKVARGGSLASTN